MERPAPFRVLILALAIAGGVWGGLAARDWADGTRLADLPPLAAHRALYRVNTLSVESGAGVAGVQGRMYYSQTESCAAWTTDQSFALTYQYPERPAVNSTSRYIAQEARNGRRLEFSSVHEENGKTADDLRGFADRGEGQAVYSRPEDVAFDLPDGFVFPTVHTAEIIRRARAGEMFYDATMFDGTDAAGPVEIAAVIGAPLTPEQVRALLPKPENIDAALIATPAWRVRMAVFPLDDGEGMTPEYEMEMILHDNGVVSYATVDYHAFKIEQVLETARSLPVQPCS